MLHDVSLILGQFLFTFKIFLIVLSFPQIAAKAVYYSPNQCTVIDIVYHLSDLTGPRGFKVKANSSFLCSLWFSLSQVDGKCQGYSELQRTIAGISQQQETLKWELAQSPPGVSIIKLHRYSNTTLENYLVGEALCNCSSCSPVSLDNSVKGRQKSNKTETRWDPRIRWLMPGHQIIHFISPWGNKTESDIISSTGHTSLSKEECWMKHQLNSKNLLLFMAFGGKKVIRIFHTVWTPAGMEKGVSKWYSHTFDSRVVGQF